MIRSNRKVAHDWQRVLDRTLQRMGRDAMKNEPAWEVGDTRDNSDKAIIKDNQGIPHRGIVSLPGSILGIGDNHPYVLINSSSSMGVIVIHTNDTDPAAVRYAEELAQKITAFLLMTEPRGEIYGDGRD